MSRTEPGHHDFDASMDARDPGLPTELWSLLKTISTQIDEADQRHTGLLQELRDRLAMLSRDAEDARHTVPESAAPLYGRIESGLAQLAQRIDAMDESIEPTLAAPAALRSAAPAAVEARTMPSSGVDPFDVVGDDDGNGEPWSSQDAEALTRIYEESDAALGRTSPQSGSPTPAPAPSHSDAGTESAVTAHGQSTAGLLNDRAWLDQRLSEIALRIEQSLAEMRPGFTVDSLGIRFDAFEERMESVLGDVATRTDVESLRLLENQIHDLASHLEQTERQLGRLDSIEQQLQAVIDHLSANFEQAAGGETFAMPDLKSLASATAEEVARRFAASMGTAAGDTRIDELGSLMRSMIHDRRQSDEQTYTMLDTVQQAMIRLLDRIDALEVAHAHAQPAKPSEPTRAAAPGAPAGAPLEVGVVHDFGAPEHDDMAPFRPHAPQYAAPVHPQTQPQAASASAPAPEMSSLDQLRQDFIADAQRAKMRAAAAAEATADSAAPATVASPARPPRGARGPAPAPAATSGPAAPGASSRKQRLTALALCLVIAVSGAALFVKRSKSPAPAEPAAVTDTTPTAVSPAASSPSVESEGDVIDVPAAPKSEAAPVSPPVPAASEGAGFEVPAEPSTPVPAPVPNGEAPAAPQGGAGVSGPVTNEDALGLGDDVPTGGDVLENRSGAVPAGQTLAPQGILLQNGTRKPSAAEMAHLQSQQNAAALSSRLGSNASRLSPADLMPEEVAKYSVTAAAASAADLEDLVEPASLAVAAMPGETINVPLAASTGAYDHKALPPATVGPLSLRLAAANGDPSAAFEVGARLAEGKGTSQNFAEAITWYQKSAAQGFAQAQYRLGTLYERGLGVKMDVARAQSWYQRAAEQGHVKAMHNLAVLSAGRISGAPDYGTAAGWFEKAAAYGLADSQYNLAVLYENGLGVAKDPVKAFMWYALASRGGDSEALRRRDGLKAQLTADQRLTAENAAASFAPKRSIPLVNDARVAGEDWKKRQNG